MLACRILEAKRGGRIGGGRKVIVGKEAGNDRRRCGRCGRCNNRLGI